MSVAEVDVGPHSDQGLVRRAWASLGTRNALIYGVAGVFLYRLWLYVAVGRFSAPRGDEIFYWRSAKVLLRMAHLHEMRALGFEEGAGRIVGRGWFVPGMSGVLAPIRLFSDEWAVGRAWVGVVAFVLLLLVVRQVDRMYSRHAAVITLLIVGLLPYTAWFSLTFWGGQVGGLLMVLNLLWAVRMGRRIRDGADPRWREHVLMGVSVAACVYIRPTTLGQVLPISIVLFLAYSSRDDFWPALRKSFLRWSAMFLVFMLLFAPWSIALMVRFDGPFLIVTSRPLSQILRYAPQEEIDRVGGSFSAWNAEIWRLAEERDQGYYEVVTAERARIGQPADAGEYLSNVSTAMTRFYDLENQFISSGFDAAAANRDNGMEPAALERLKSRFMRINSWTWAALTFLVIYTLMRRWSLWQSEGWLGIVLRAAMAMALFQPLTGGPHGRHISFLVPLFALSVALALDSRMRHDVLPMPTIAWPRIERLVATAFPVMIAGFLAFYFAS